MQPVIVVRIDFDLPWGGVQQLADAQARGIEIGQALEAGIAARPCPAKQVRRGRPREGATGGVWLGQPGGAERGSGVGFLGKEDVSVGCVGAVGNAKVHLQRAGQEGPELWDCLGRNSSLSITMRKMIDPSLPPRRIPRWIRRGPCNAQTSG